MNTKNKDGFKIWYALSIAFQLGFIVAVPIGAFMFLGAWVDRFLGSSPLLIILGAVAGVGITVYEVYHLFLPLIKESNDK